MEHKRILITGATSGLGKAASLRLAGKNNEILLLARNPQKALATKEEIIQQTENRNLEIILCDLSSLSQVEKAAQRVKNVDILINNAGGVHSKKQITENDFELTFQVDYLSHFLLTNSLRIDDQVLNLSSVMHRYGKIHFDEIENPDLTRYLSVKAYAQAKLANVLFTYSLNDNGVNANVYDPGFVKTDVGREGYIEVIMKIIKPFFSAPKQSAQEIEEILDKKISGKYFSHSQEIPSSRRSYEKKLRDKLWIHSLYWSHH
jgi:NAD(P)-dependent dehydrogenase (short-subunit alcohol dehydrogenase family)